MKFLKRKDIRWDIVRRTAKSNPLWILGCPITVHTRTSKTLIGITRVQDKKCLEVRIPFTSKIVWDWNWKDGNQGVECSDPNISHETWVFRWNGFFFFWRIS